MGLWSRCQVGLRELDLPSPQASPRLALSGKNSTASGLSETITSGPGSFCRITPLIAPGGGTEPPPPPEAALQSRAQRTADADPRPLAPLTPQLQGSPKPPCCQEEGPALCGGDHLDFWCCLGAGQELGLGREGRDHWHPGQELGVSGERPGRYRHGWEWCGTQAGPRPHVAPTC